MVSTGNGFLVRTSARNSGVAAYVTYSVRLQTAFLQKIGASRRYRSGCPTIRRGHLPLFDRIVTQFPLPPRHSREAKQGTSGNRTMEAGSRRGKPGTSFFALWKSVNPSSSGNRTRSVVATGLRDEACSFTQGRRLRQCG